MTEGTGKMVTEGMKIETVGGETSSSSSNALNKALEKMFEEDSSDVGEGLKYQKPSSSLMEPR